MRMHFPEQTFALFVSKYTPWHACANNKHKPYATSICKLHLLIIIIMSRETKKSFKQFKNFTKILSKDQSSI